MGNSTSSNGTVEPWAYVLGAVLGAILLVFCSCIATVIYMRNVVRETPKEKPNEHRLKKLMGKMFTRHR